MNQQKIKPFYQRKKGRKGVKSLRGIPELYDEKKRQFNATLTPNAIAVLQIIADKLGDSRSQILEKALRGEIDLMEILKSQNPVEFPKVHLPLCKS